MSGDGIARKVLVIDDEPSVRLLLERELTERGYIVTASGDPEKATEIAAREGFDVVITDIRMPCIDGLEVTRRIKASNPRTEIILMTGYASLETAAEGMHLGAYDYIAKHFGNLDLVVASLERALERSQLSSLATELQRQLAHSDRLAAIGQLAAGVAHEINNPAGFVMANLTVMKQSIKELGALMTQLRSAGEAPPTPEKVAALQRWLEENDAENLTRDFEEMIEDNLEGVRRVSSIVKDLRTFARIDREEVELVRLGDIADVAVRIVRNEVRHRARLIREIGDVRPIPVHRGKLAQVVVNLLVNASHAMPDQHETENIITLTVAQEAKGVALTVRDTGCGMPDDVKARIFEPFFTTKPRGTGTGLGLSLSAEIVRQHRGEISVESEIGVGTSFHIRIPFDTGLSPGSATQPPPKRAPRKRGRILIVDDEPLLLSACRRMLEPHHDVHLAHDGKEALALLQRDQNFDVIICDLMMPGVDGARVHNELKSTAPKLAERLLFTSGGAVTPRITAFAASLGQALLEKPFTAEQLMAAVDRTLAYAA